MIKYFNEYAYPSNNYKDQIIQYKTIRAKTMKWIFKKSINKKDSLSWAVCV